MIKSDATEQKDTPVSTEKGSENSSLDKSTDSAQFLPKNEKRVVRISNESSENLECMNFDPDVTIPALTRNRVAQLEAWDKTLEEYEQALSRGNINEVYRFAYPDTYNPFRTSKYILIIAESIMTQAKYLMLEQTPHSGMSSLKESIGQLRDIFKAGPSEDLLYDWLEEASDLQNRLQQA